MVQFRREDNMAIWLIFDSVGLGRLLEVLSRALTGGRPFLEANVDMSVITMKRSSKTTATSVWVEISDETQLLKRNDKVLWVLTKEDLGSAIDRLEQCRTAGYFTPAEFIRVQVPKNRRLDYIYCELAR